MRNISNTVWLYLCLPVYLVLLLGTLAEAGSEKGYEIQVRGSDARVNRAVLRPPTEYVGGVAAVRHHKPHQHRHHGHIQPTVARDFNRERDVVEVKLVAFERTLRLGMENAWINGLLFGQYGGRAFWGPTAKSISRLDRTEQVMVVPER